MKNLTKTFRVALLVLFVGLLHSCSNENHLTLDNLSVENKKIFDFAATLSPQQEKNLENSGDVFLPDQQKNSWNNVIAEDVPARWGG